MNYKQTRAQSAHRLHAAGVVPRCQQHPTAAVFYSNPNSSSTTTLPSSAHILHFLRNPTGRIIILVCSGVLQVLGYK